MHYVLILYLVLCTFVIDIISGILSGEEIYTCDRYEEKDSHISNCISDTIFFPASRATCDYCNKSVQYKCTKDKVWQPVKSLPKCQKDSQSNTKNLQCKGLKDYTLICSKLDESKFYYLGTRTVCRCKSNCREVVEECLQSSNNDTNPFWGSGLNYNPCDNSPWFKSDGPLNISYSTQRYSFTCIKGYNLVGTSSESICRNGKLTGTKPICEKINATIIDNENVSKKSSIDENVGFMTISSTYSPMKVEMNETEISTILYIIIGLLSIVSISLFIYLIYTRGKRREIENNVKVVEPEAHYDYPVFNAVNANEDPNYDYPVFPIHSDQNNHEQPTYEYVTMNELYQCSKK